MVNVMVKVGRSVLSFRLQVLLILITNIQVLRAAVTIVAPTTAQVTIGRSISVFCYGEDGDQLHWIDEDGNDLRQGTRAGVSVASLSRSIIVLKFTNAEGAHEGVYCCSTVQSSCSAGLNATVEVIIPSKNFVVSKAQYVVPDSNGDVFLRCEVNPGDPKPRKVWYKQGKGFLNLSNSSNSKYAANYSGLLIRQFGNNDTGGYTCEYLNYLSGSFSSDIEVRPRDHVLIQGPQKVLLGSSAASLRCIYDSSVTDSRVRWILPDGSAHPDAILKIVNASIDQAGTYQCKLYMLTKPDEVLKEVHHNVTVYNPPQPPAVRNKITVYSGTQVQLRFVLKNEPIPPLSQPRWTKNGNALTPSSKFSIDDMAGVLTISSVTGDDAGQYMCEGKNEFGQSAQIYDVNWVAGGASGVDKEVVLTLWLILEQTGETPQLSCNDLQADVSGLQNSLSEHFLKSMCHCRIGVAVVAIKCNNETDLARAPEVTLHLNGSGVGNVAFLLTSTTISLLNSTLRLVPQVASPDESTSIIFISVTVSILTMVVFLLITVLLVTACIIRFKRKKGKRDSNDANEANDRTAATSSGERTIYDKVIPTHTLGESPNLTANPSYIPIRTTVMGRAIC